MKFCTEIRGLKSKIEFVWDELKSDDPFAYFIPFYPCNAFSMGMF